VKCLPQFGDFVVLAVLNCWRLRLNWSAMIEASRIQAVTFVRMKKIEAILKPSKVEQVKEALGKLGIDGMTLSEVKALDRPKPRSETRRNGGSSATFLPEVKIEVVVSDGHAAAALAAVIKNGRTGRGKASEKRVFVSEVEQVVRIRTEEWDEAAI